MAEHLSPEAIVRWCQSAAPGDPYPFEALVGHYKRLVFTICYRLMGNQQDAEDQAQEVFLKIHRGIRSLEEPAAVTRWVTTITSNTCLEALARQKRRPKSSPLPDEDEPPPQYADARTPTPEEAALRDEVRRCIDRALRRMDSDARAVLVLRDLHDRPYQEIADQLALGLSAVKMRIHRARQLFQQVIEVVCPGVARTISG
jgi:RNA polymerase sigma-70 factor (ECF subfamily)